MTGKTQHDPALAVLRLSRKMQRYCNTAILYLKEAERIYNRAAAKKRAAKRKARKS